MRTWTTTEQARHRELLVAALRSGDYEQAREKLFGEVCTEQPDGTPISWTGKLGYCCLGVGCVVAKNAGLDDIEITLDLKQLTGHVRYEYEDTFMDTDTELPESAQHFYGFVTDAGHLHKFWDRETKEWVQPPPGQSNTPDPGRFADSLVRLNDDARFTFEQIADVIEQGLVRTL